MEVNTASGGFIGGGFGGFGGFGGGIVPTIDVGRDRGRGDEHCRCYDRGRRDDDGMNPVFAATILSKLGSVEGLIPLSALGTQNAILEQTIALTSSISEANISQLQAAAGVKDSVQNSATAILSAVAAVSTKIDQNRIAELETELSRVRAEGRSRDVEVNVNQTVSQVQAQAQFQAQFQAQINALVSVFNDLKGDIQAVKQGQVIFNAGTMAGSGSQGAANTKVA